MSDLIEKLSRLRQSTQHQVSYSKAAKQFNAQLFDEIEGRAKELEAEQERRFDITKHIIAYLRNMLRLSHERANELEREKAKLKGLLKEDVFSGPDAPTPLRKDGE